MNTNNRNNLGKRVIDDFGNEWNQFDQLNLEDKELKNNFLQYFNIFPLDELDRNKEGFDLGCGSGRWAKLIAPKIKKLNCIDPSEKALEIAKLNLKKFNNVNFINQQISNIEIDNNT